MPNYSIDTSLSGSEQGQIQSLLTSILNRPALAAAIGPAADTLISFTDVSVAGKSGAYTAGSHVTGDPKYVKASAGLAPASIYIRLDPNASENVMWGTGTVAPLGMERALFHEMMHARFDFHGDGPNPANPHPSLWQIQGGVFDLEEELAVAAENLIYVPAAMGMLNSSNVRIGHQSDYSGSPGTSGALFFSGFGPAQMSVDNNVTVRFTASNGTGSVSREYHAPGYSVGGQQYVHYILDTIHLNSPLLNASANGVYSAGGSASRFIDSVMHSPAFTSTSLTGTAIAAALSYTLRAPNFASAAGAAQSSAVGLGADHYFDYQSGHQLDIAGVIDSNGSPPSTISIDRSGALDGEIIFGAASATGSHDKLIGGSGNDLIISHASHNTGQDELYGGDGDDLLIASG
ncbi:MAG: hypothetical protein JST65_01930, partial [Acidobacteria bacterium]|nr:hypothetical protein [Acidobacteriota bacterium]